jgi:hypothetical protein
MRDISRRLSEVTPCYYYYYFFEKKEKEEEEEDFKTYGLSWTRT